MENTKNLISELKKYFDAKVIGSYMFVEFNYLNLEDINDIDLMISSNLKDNIENYLIDKGYVEKTVKDNGDGYGNPKIVKTGIFLKENEKDIHLVYGDNSIFDIPELVMSKFRRGKRSDIIQLSKVIHNKLSRMKPDAE